MLLSSRKCRDDLVVDLGMSDELNIMDYTEAEECAMIVDRIRHRPDYHIKGSTVKVCRFANITDSLAAHDESWTWAKLRLMHYASEEGILQNVDWEGLFKASSGAMGDTVVGANGRVEVGRSNDLVKKYRAALKSNVELALAIMLNPTSRAIGRVLFKLVGPIRKWYGEQNSLLRSTSAMLKFFKTDVEGGRINAPLRDTLRFLQDASLLQDIGLQVYFPPKHQSWGEHHPWLADQDYIAELAARYACSLVKGRWKRLQHLTHGWTGRQVGFCSDNEETRVRTSREFVSEFNAYEEACKQTSAFWKKACKRSTWNLVPAQQLLQMLLANDCKVSNRMAEHVSKRLSGLGQSLISENCVGVGRKLESSAANKQQQPAASFWARLINTGVSRDLFKYREPQWQDRVAPIGNEAALPKNAFKVQLKDSPSWVGDIVGASRQPPWFSTSATYGNLPYCDLFLMSQALKPGQSWANIAKNCFLSQLAGGRNLALSPVGSKNWYYSLGHQHGVLVIAWPCKAKYEGSRLLELTFDLESMPCWLLVCDDQWMATTIKWCSPASAVALGRMTPAQTNASPCIAALVVAKPQRLLQEAAANGFWDLKGAGLKPIMRYLDLEVHDDQSDIDRLQALVRHVFPKTSNEGMLNILEKRFKDYVDLDGMALMEEASELLDPQDQKKIESRKAVLESLKESTNEFVQEFAKLRIKLSKIVHRTLDGHPVKGRFPDTPISQGEAQRLFPSPVRVYSDNVNARWQAYWPELGSRSRSWNTHGLVEGLRQLLQWAWSETLARAGQSAKDCPVEGVFSVAQAAEAAASSSVAASSSS